MVSQFLRRTGVLGFYLVVLFPVVLLVSLLAGFTYASLVGCALALDAAERVRLR